MRKNLYTKTINDIKISENAVNSAIENIYSKQSNDNIIDIKKSKNKKVNKVIAASLVAAMLVSGGAFALFSSLLKIKTDLLLRPQLLNYQKTSRSKLLK